MQIDFNCLANPSILNIHPYTPGKPIEELQRESGLTHIIKLASNENPLGASKQAIAAAQNTLTQIYRYPDANGFELKQKLAQHLGIEAAQLTLGTGSDNVLALLAQAFVNPKKEIIISEYAFATYSIIAHAVDAKLIVVPAVNWAHDLMGFADHVTDNTQLMFLANPNNPTGTWFSEAELRQLLEQIPPRIIVVIDEAYVEYVNEPNFPNTLKLQESHPNLVITRTFSKIYGLAGFRVGYSISHPTIADLLNRIRLPFNVSTPALAAATAALDAKDHVNDSLKMNRDGMKQLTTGLQNLGLSHIPSIGNFITIDFGSEANSIYQSLLGKGIIVRPLVNYNMPHHLRVTIGKAEENSQFLDALT